MTRMPRAMLKEVRTNPIQEAVLILLPKVLHEVPLRPLGVLWEQRGVPLLQQLEDQARRTKMPLTLS